jgi:CubicO group peptidase (beta-lactamase class C family)
LDASLARLGIDDVPPALTEVEKQATVRQLLEARSGVYHPALYETEGMARRRPVRGSHAPGTFWYYNNWDFNTLGTIYERAVGKSIFAAFADEIAAKLEMQDYRLQDGRYVRGDDVSLYPAYPFHMSARDLARFGLLYARGGMWQGQQIVPAAWVRESTTAHSQTYIGSGYGYLWWTGFPDRRVPIMGPAPGRILGGRRARAVHLRRPGAGFRRGAPDRRAQRGRPAKGAADVLGPGRGENGGCGKRSGMIRIIQESRTKSGLPVRPTRANAVPCSQRTRSSTSSSADPIFDHAP